jgi:putative nucleotidyltransferase with HDIG domain
MSDESSQPLNGEREKEKSELSKYLDPDFPLLKEFRTKCPGTFKHSQTVSSMVEGVCLALDLDATYMKVMAIYHDIGKMFHPEYYTENQMDEDNVHDKLDPYISFLIISRHVSDTCLILTHWGFPQELIQLACQHHGTAVVRYFFDKSKTDIEDRYRYNGETPKTIEAMVLMLCDHLEAKSRSMMQHDKQSFNPTDAVLKVWEELESDRQTADVIMKLGDVATLKEALAKELGAMYQKRVDYKKAKEE